MKVKPTQKMMFVSERVLTLGKIVAELYNHDCFFKSGLITENHMCVAKFAPGK